MFKDNMTCPLKCQKEEAVDDQRHLLLCPVLLAELSSEEEEDTRRVTYNDMYGSVDSQKRMVKVVTRLLEIRSNLLNLTPTSGLTLDASEQ